MAVSLATNALTTLDTVKGELGITDASQDDTLTRYINMASDFAEQYCATEFFYEEDIEEKVAGYGSMFLQVSRVPLLSIDSISLGGDDLDSDNYEIHPDGAEGRIYFLSGTTWTAASLDVIDTTTLPGSERREYIVTYTGGYITPKQEDEAVGTRTLPWDLEDACISMVNNRYAMKGKDSGVKSEKLLSWAVTYGDSGTSGQSRGRSFVSQDVIDVLDNYRKVVVV